MTRLRPSVLLASCAVSVAACVPESGFVEIKRKVTLHRDDVLVINRTTVTNLHSKDSAVVKQPAGMTTLSLKRGERVEKLCEFPIAKNRLTTVTLTSVNALVRCKTQS